MLMKKILILVIIQLISLNQLKAQIVFDEVGLGVSYWLRSYSTPDERILLINPPSQNGEINPVIVPHLFGRLRLGEYFGLRGKIGFAQDSFNSFQELGNSVRYEKIEQTIIPTGLMIDFSIPLKKGEIAESKSDESEEVVIDSKFNLVGGIGVNRYFIQHTFSREVLGSDGSISDAKFSGNDFGIGVMLGLSYQLATRIILTAFSQYNSGTYLHRLYSEELIGSYETKIISIKGVEFGFSLGYNLSK
jgi:hypothetical protein